MTPRLKNVRHCPRLASNTLHGLVAVGRIDRERCEAVHGTVRVDKCRGAKGYDREEALGRLREAKRNSVRDALGHIEAFILGFGCARMAPCEMLRSRGHENAKVACMW